MSGCRRPRRLRHAASAAHQWREAHRGKPGRQPRCRPSPGPSGYERQPFVAAAPAPGIRGAAHRRTRWPPRIATPGTWPGIMGMPRVRTPPFHPAAVQFTNRDHRVTVVGADRHGFASGGRCDRTGSARPFSPSFTRSIAQFGPELAAVCDASTWSRSSGMGVGRRDLPDFLRVVPGAGLSSNTSGMRTSRGI